MSAPTKEQLASGVQAITAVAEAIRAVGQIPSGHLYAQVLGTLSFESYAKIIDILKGAELIEETPTHLLRWVGPTIVDHPAQASARAVLDSDERAAMADASSAAYNGALGSARKALP